jgi:hypothetical protein
MHADNINRELQRPIRLEVTWRDHLLTILHAKIDSCRVWWDKWWCHAGNVETHNATVFNGFCHKGYRSRFLTKE